MLYEFKTLTVHWNLWQYIYVYSINKIMILLMNFDFKKRFAFRGIHIHYFMFLSPNYKKMKN